MLRTPTIEPSKYDTDTVIDEVINNLNDIISIKLKYYKVKELYSDETLYLMLQRWKNLSDSESIYLLIKRLNNLYIFKTEEDYKYIWNGKDKSLLYFKHIDDILEEDYTDWKIINTEKELLEFLKS